MSKSDHLGLASEVAASIMAARGRYFTDRAPGLFELPKDEIERDVRAPEWQQPISHQRDLVESLVIEGILAGMELREGLAVIEDRAAEEQVLNREDL